MKDHTGDELSAKTFSSAVKSPPNKNDSTTSKTAKRGMSVSPEKPDKKALRSTNKKI